MSRKSSPVQVTCFKDSVCYALQGIRLVFSSEKNFRTHLVIAAIAITLGMLRHFSSEKWMVLVLCILLMLATETLNTAIEYLVDWISGGQVSVEAAQVKNLSAAACLIVATGALIIGFFLFVL
jgi:diacylglycerol kinase